MSPVIPYEFEGIAGIYLPLPQIGARSWHSHESIRKLFARTKNLKELSERFHVAVRTVLKFLRIAEADFLGRFWEMHRSGMTWTQVAQENGMKTRTLTKLMKDNGYTVSRGPKVKTRDEAEVVEAITETTTPGGLAKKLKLGWTTAKGLWAIRDEFLALHEAELATSENIDHSDTLRRMGLYWVQPRCQESGSVR